MTAFWQTSRTRSSGPETRGSPVGCHASFAYSTKAFTARGGAARTLTLTRHAPRRTGACFSPRSSGRPAHAGPPDAEEGLTAPIRPEGSQALWPGGGARVLGAFSTELSHANGAEHYGVAAHLWSRPSS